MNLTLPVCAFDSKVVRKIEELNKSRGELGVMNLTLPVCALDGKVVEVFQQSASVESKSVAFICRFDKGQLFLLVCCKPWLL